MFHSLPVVVGTINHDFEQSVDYIDARPESGSGGINNSTRVPTSMLITVTMIPLISRTRQTDFSLKDYAAGRLIGSKRGPGTMP